MKALLLVEDDLKVLDIEACIKPVGFEVIRYRNPLKVIDNLDEIAPDAVIVSALDFPRHWKIIAEVVRAVKDKHACVIILLRGEHFGFDEADKASHLGVNGIVSDRLTESHEKDRLVRILARYIQLKEMRSSTRIPIAEWDNCVFIFCHPASARILCGRIASLSAAGISFEPEDFEAAADLDKGMMIPSASLKIGADILSIDCVVIRTGSLIGLSFESIAEGKGDLLGDWIARSPERELAATAGGMLIIPEL